MIGDRSKFAFAGWVFLTLMLLAFAKAIIAAIHFENLSKGFGVPAGGNPVCTLVSRKQLRKARRTKRVIACAVAICPWDVNCYPQAIVARVLLGIHGVPYTLNLGVRKAGPRNELEAHAWLHAGSCAVTGGGSYRSHVLVNCYGKQSWRPLVPALPPTLSRAAKGQAVR